MKKVLIVTATVFLALGIITFIVAVVISFKVVKQTTDKINFAVKDQIQPLVRIPSVIPPETKSFDKTIYIWEMETKEGEIIKVKLTHDTAFSQKVDKVNMVLEMDGGDPSVFNKVLPAVIADKQTIISIVDPKRMNTESNPDAHYNKIDFTTKPETGQVTKVIWEFNKEFLTSRNEDLYNKIYSHPEPILKGLYKLQRIILEVFST